LIIEPTYRSARKHWDEVIRANAFVALQTIAELDQATFGQVKGGLKVAKAKKVTDLAARNTNWIKIFDAAKAMDRNIKPIILDGKQYPP
jgi:hypothetical protein